MAKDRNKPSTTSKTPVRPSSRTAERRKERERERRQRQIITYVIIAIAVVAVIVFVFFIVNAPAEAPISEAALTRYENVAHTITQDGYPRLGAASAPVQVAEYSSFDCPHCYEFHAEVIDDLVSRVEDGYMSLTYVPLYGFGGIANGQGAAAAALCAADQDKFWQFHDALFEWQGQYGSQAFTNNRIISGVEALELNRGQYDSCINSGEPGDTLALARSQSASLLNFTGTPTITVNGVVPLDEDQQPLTDNAAILAYIDAQIERAKTLYGSATPEATAEPLLEATSEATVEAGELASATVEPTAEITPEATIEPTAEVTTAS